MMLRAGSILNSGTVHSGRSALRLGTDPQRLAWGMLLIAFAIFCVVCVSVGVGINYFLFQSTVQLNVVLTVGRGSVGIIEPSNERFIRTPTSIVNGTEITTDSQSQSVVLFMDAQFDETLVADVTLKADSNVVLRSASQPRFEWSRSDYLIDLRNAMGEFEVNISESKQRNVVVSIQSKFGDTARINLNGAGRYIVEISQSQISVYNRKGNAFVLPDAWQGYSIPVNQMGLYRADSKTLEIYPGYQNLLENSHFDTLSPTVSPGSTQELLSHWLCGNDPNDAPQGLYRSQFYEGRMTLKLERYEGAITHGRTFCSQTFGANALDVRSLNLDYLSLHAFFRIHHQSLSVCGVDGSECPLMLRMDYIDSQGDARQWFHGFYSRRDANPVYPSRCSSCSLEHEFVNEKTWYSYDSGNLLTLFPPDQQIAALVGIWFYASGHEYDVQVQEVALLARQQVNAPVAVEEVGG